MFFSTSFDAKKIWQNYNVRGAILLSLFLQILLVFIGPARKRTGKGSVTILIWGAYLFADWVAGFTVGLISSGQGKKYHIDQDLAAFWSPFLLVHLGGQDTVTAFALEDNQLWVRRLLELFVHLGAVAYIFIQTFPNRFRISTALMFFAGTIKYAERTRALYLACLTNFKAHVLQKPDAGPEYAQLMEEYSLNKAFEIPVSIVIKKELEGESSKPTEYHELTPKQVVRRGFKFYGTFRGMMVDLMFSFHERNQSREFFFQTKFKDAFAVIEVELNFMYDVFYTKMNVVHRKIGYLFRFFCDVFILVSFQQFICFHEHELQRIDIAVSYTLFAGAIGLDLVALMMVIFSDWTIASLKDSKALDILCRIRENLPFKRSRWSNSMSQHNLIGYCLEERFIWLDNAAKFFALREILDEYQYKKAEKVDDGLKEFIFLEVTRKAKEAKDAKDAKLLYSSKGSWVLTKEGFHSTLSTEATPTEEIVCDERLLLESVDEEVEFDKSLLLWHIATELCYSESPEGEYQNLDDDTRTQTLKNRHNSKRLSDYMLYLLVMRRTMMSSVQGIGQTRFADTCEEAKKYFQRESLLKRKRSDPTDRKKKACEKLMSVDTVVKPVAIKGDRCQSLLFDGCMLAQALKKQGFEKKWKIMSQVWVELLAYAATHIRAEAHGQQLSKGGELVTFVWLLMAHFGLGEQFRIQAGTARAKLVVGKESSKPHSHA